MKKILKRAGAAALGLYRSYPARCNAVIAGGAVAALGAIGISVDLASAKEVVALELPILLAGEATHRRVRPLR